MAQQKRNLGDTKAAGWVHRVGERGVAPLIFVIAALVVLLAAGAGVGAYVLLRSVTHPNEETAKFLPADTDIYYSLNLRPGGSQLLRLRPMITRYTDDPDFQEKVDELVEEVQDETGIHLLDEVVPWLGPELAIGVIDVGGIANDPQVVTFVGTSDIQAAEDILLRFIEYLEDDEELDFKRDSYKDFTIFLEEEEGEVHFAITEDYLLTATTERLLKDTIDMMVESVDALSEKEEFKAARDSVRDERFSFLYVNVESIIDQFRVLASAAGAGEALQAAEDQLPSILAISSSFVDSGIRIDGFFETPVGIEAFPSANSLAWADLLPEDTLALISTTGLKEALDGARTQFGDLGLDIDEALEEFEGSFGIDIEGDILDWMAGEVAISVLPAGLSLDFFGDFDSLFHALAMLQFSDQQQAQEAMDNLVEALENLGVPFDQVDIDGQEATIADLRAFMGDSGYSPGFVLLDDYVVLGTTELALEEAVEAWSGDERALSAEPEFSRVLDMAPEDWESLFFIDLEGLFDIIAASMGAEERAEYRESIRPFVEPLKVILAGSQTGQEDSTFTIVLTIE